jgi:signal transduction histidine kinase
VTNTKRASILVVEDERIVAIDLQETLASLGYDAFAVASSSDEAIAEASRRCPDLVLMDVRIRGARDGIDTAAMLRQRFDVGVVYLTAHADQATIDRAKQTEPYGYLVKPVKPAELLGTIEVALHRRLMETRARQRERVEQDELRRQLEASNRLVALGTMVAGVAHELNNPLAVVAANASTLGDELASLRGEIEGGGATLRPEADRRFRTMADLLTDLRSASRRIQRIVVDLRGFVRPASPESAQRADVARAVDWAVRTVAHEAKHRARLVTDLSEVPAVEGDETRLGQVLVNLLVNAAQAISPGREDDHEIRVVARDGEDGRVVIEVRDTGPGIPDDVMERVFEPFFTTKPAGVGTGLGLSISRGIVTAMNGTIDIESRAGGGTVCRLTLSAARSTRAASVPPPSAGPPSAPHRSRILIVEDEDMIVRLLQRVLREHDLVSTSSGEGALERIRRGERFDVILSDLAMPQMSGMDLYEEILRRDPVLARRVVFMSGGVTSSRVNDFLASIPNERVEKPFDVPALLGAIERARAIGRG